jgi:ATP-dependent helicase/DNAse subunit B
LKTDLSPDEEKFACASPHDGRVSASPRLRQFMLEGHDGELRRWSAGQLTELAACGFKFFARRLLLLRETDDADHEMNALETGSVIHEILRTIFERAGQSGVAGLQAVKREVLGEFHRRLRLTARDPAFFELDWASISTMADEVADYELARGEWPVEMYHEQEFDFAAAGLEISTAEPFELALTGQIDRIEVYRDRGRIVRIKLVDYKAARRLKRYADLLKPERFGCEDLQMPLYALAAAERFRAELADDATVELSYLALKTRAKESEPRTIPLPLLTTPSPISRGTVAARIFDLVNSAAAGRFDVDPLECSDHCPYRRICRYHKP